MLDKKLQQEINIVMTAAKSSGLEFVTVEHLLLALTNVDEIINLFEDKNINVDEMRKELNEFIDAHTPTLPESSGIEIVPTVGFERVLQRSVYEAQLIKKPTVYAIDILTSIFSEKDSHAAYLLEINNISDIDTLKSNEYINKNSVTTGNVVIKENGEAMLINSNKPYTGEYNTYYDDGKLAASTNYINGLIHGKQCVWNERGVLTHQSHHIKGKASGLFTWYLDDGEKILESKFVNGKKHGLSTDWHGHGVKKSEVYYIDGLENGMYTHWHTNGLKINRAVYVNGEIDGLYTDWHGNGRKEFEGGRKKDKLEGVCTWYYENGEIKSQGLYQDGELVNTKAPWKEIDDI